MLTLTWACTFGAVTVKQIPAIAASANDVNIFMNSPQCCKARTALTLFATEE
jgi:hypothetical protein